MAPRIIGDTGASPLIDVDELNKGEYAIGTSAGRMGTNAPSLLRQGIPPRPTGGSSAPRPMGFQAKGPGVFGTAITEDERKESFAKMKAARVAGPVSKREAGVKAVGAEDRAKVAKAEKAQLLADERAHDLAMKVDPAKVKAEGEMAVAQEVSRRELEIEGSEAKTEAAKLESAERIADLDRKNELLLSDDENLRNTRDNDTQERVTQMQENTKLIKANLEQQGITTPTQQASLDKINGNNDRLVAIESGLAKMAASEFGDETIQKALADARTTIIADNEALQESIMFQGAGTADIAEGEQVATTQAEPVGDLNGDGTPNDADDREANTRITKIRQYEALQKANPDDDRLTANNAAALYEKAKIEQAEWAKRIKNPKV